MIGWTMRCRSSLLQVLARGSREHVESVEYAFSDDIL